MSLFETLTFNGMVWYNVRPGKKYLDQVLTSFRNTLLWLSKTALIGEEAGTVVYQPDSFDWKAALDSIAEEDEIVKLPTIKEVKEADKNVTELEWITKNAASFLEAHELARGRRLFKTTYHHHIGMGPANMQSGDEVVIIPGAKVPFIIRRTSPVEDRYKFIGEAFVCGFMEGQTVRCWKQSTNIMLE